MKMLTMKIKYWLPTLCILASAPVWAQVQQGKPPVTDGGEVSGGGNAILAADFVGIATELSQELYKRSPILPDWFSISDFNQALRDTKVYAVTELKPREVKETGIYINAQFFREPKMILVKWKEIQGLNKPELQHLVLHEYFGVLNYEGDGQYSKSSQLALILGTPPLIENSGRNNETIDVDAYIKSCENYKPSVYHGTQLPLLPDAEDEEKLSYQISNGMVSEIKKRIELGLDPNSTVVVGSKRYSQLPHCKEGFACIERDPQFMWKESLLGAAVSSRWTDLVILLLEKGANPNLKSPMGHQPNYYNWPLGNALRVRYGDDPEVLRQLVLHGANLKNQGKFDPLWMQALTPSDDDDWEELCPQIAKVNFLKKHGLKLNELAGGRSTENGVSWEVYYPSVYGLAMNNNNLAIQIFHKLGATLTQRIQVVGAPKEHEDWFEDGDSVLHGISRAGKTRTVSTAKFLVSHGVDPKWKNSKNETALDVARNRYTQYCVLSEYSDSKEKNGHCAAKKALIEYLESVTP